LLSAIRRELGAIIAFLHRIDFGKTQNQNPMSGMDGGPSAYMKDLVEKLAFVKSEILSKFSVGDDEKEWFVRAPPNLMSS
jgi:conserved oligomeric Golgi complex subunit 5